MISELTIKIPEPIIEPATIIVASINPNDLLNDLSSNIASSAVNIVSDIVAIFFQDKYFKQKLPFLKGHKKSCISRILNVRKYQIYFFFEYSSFSPLTRSFVILNIVSR